MAARKRKGKENTEMCSPKCGKRHFVTHPGARLYILQLSLLLRSHHIGGRAVTVRTPRCSCPRALWLGTRDGKGGKGVRAPPTSLLFRLPALRH